MRTKRERECERKRDREGGRERVRVKTRERGGGRERGELYEASVFRSLAVSFARQKRSRSFEGSEQSE